MKALTEKFVCCAIFSNMLACVQGDQACVRAIVVPSTNASAASTLNPQPNREPLHLDQATYTHFLQISHHRYILQAIKQQIILA